MPSVVAGYSYDIFISYRQKDNKVDGWVTSFVSNLKKELEAAFKGDVSIYFDQNPIDGILETHHVDETVAAKIKCLVFIPIISQTYCDPKSFAWAQEFRPFVAFAKADKVGLNVKLRNGNTACRVLPVQIHDLEVADKQLVETELGGALRSIDFIYRAAGVVRTLQQNEENPKANLSQIFYRDQMSKLVRGIKELISATQSPVGASQTQAKVSQGEIPVSARRKLSIAAVIVVAIGILGYALFYFSGFGNSFFQEPDKSIAVIPFENMNNDPEQEYFSNGIAEDILNHLVKIADLKVKSRTSTLQYKGTTKTISEIGDELNVSNVVEGTVRRVGDKLRIVVQLIDTKTDTQLWSETYDRELKDVLALQSEIAIEIASALKARLTSVERENIEREITQDVTAYDFFLKAKEVTSHGLGAARNIDKRDFENALLLLNQSLRLDSNFSRAYALKGLIWFDLGKFGVSQKTWQDSAMYFSSKAVALDPASPDGYIVRGNVHRYLGRREEARADFKSAFTIAPNDPFVLSTYGYQLMNERDESGADLILRGIENQYSRKDPEYYYGWSDPYSAIGDVSTQETLLQKAKSLNPGLIQSYINLAWLYRATGQYAKGIREAEQAEKIDPTFAGASDMLGWLHYLNGDLEKSLLYWSRYPEIEAVYEDSTQTIPFRNRVAMVYSKMGRKKEADALVLEDLKIRSEILASKQVGTWGPYGTNFYGMAVDNAYFGNNANAVACLDSLLQYHAYYFEWGWRNDPMFSSLRDRDDFKKVMKKMDDNSDFRKSAFTKALNRAKGSRELKALLER